MLGWVKLVEFKVSSDATEIFDKVVFMKLVEKLGTKLCMKSENTVNEQLISHHFVENLLRPAYPPIPSPPQLPQFRL